MKKIQRKSKQDDKNTNNNNTNNADKNETEHATNTTSSVCSGGQYACMTNILIGLGGIHMDSWMNEILLKKHIERTRKT